MDGEERHFSAVGSELVRVTTQPFGEGDYTTEGECEENERGAHSISEKNVRCGHTSEKRRGRPNLRWKDACKRDMTEVGLKEDNTTNRAEWKKKLISYTGDPR